MLGVLSGIGFAWVLANRANLVSPALVDINVNISSAERAFMCMTYILICIISLFINVTFPVYPVLLFCFLLFTSIAWSDYFCGIVPNHLLLVLIPVSMVFLVVHPQYGWGNVIAALIIYISLYFLREGVYVFLKRDVFGMGDVKLIAVMALFIGWETLWIVWIAACLGGLWSILGMISGIYTLHNRIPFAPFLMAGMVVGFIIESTFIIEGINEIF